jgi:hypothetical protein
MMLADINLVSRLRSVISDEDQRPAGKRMSQITAAFC